MVEKRFNRVGEAPLIVQIPSSINEMSFNRAANISKPGLSDLEYIEAFTDVPVDTLYDVSDIAKMQAELTPYAETILHQALYAYRFSDVPQYINIETDLGMKKINVHKAIRNLNALAYINISEVVATDHGKYIMSYGRENYKRNLKPSLDAVLKIVAHLFYTDVYEQEPGKDGKDIERFCDVLKYMPLTVIAPIGHTLYFSYPDFNIKTTTLWQTMKIKYRDVKNKILLKRKIKRLAKE